VGVVAFAASFGVARPDERDQGIEALLRRADQAMYLSKKKPGIFIILIMSGLAHQMLYLLNWRKNDRNCLIIALIMKRNLIFFHFEFF
jgi:GGDEF domain-containing protein